MKRLFAILMALCLSVSLFAFVSCDKGGDDGDSGEITTTVTKEQWESMFVVTNVTINGTYVEDGLEEHTILVADNKMVSSIVEHDGEFTTYIFKRDGKWYMGRIINGINACQEFSYIGDEINLTMLGFIFNYQDKYDSFTYDEENKCYVYETEDRVSTQEQGTMTVTTTRYADTAKIYVENGKLIRIVFIKGASQDVVVYEDGTEEIFTSDENVYDYSFSSYGSTVIDNFPEF